VKRGLEVVPVDSMDILLQHALVKPIVPIEWTEETAAPAVLPPPSDERPGITH
jgi:ATP-dependent Lon protease